MRIATPDDAAEIDRICNHPEVRRWTAPPGAPACDAARWLVAPQFAILFEGGVFLMQWNSPYRYVVHTNILPEARGRRALEAGRAAMKLGFTATGIEEAYTMVPENNPAARWFAGHMGFTKRFSRETVWPTAEGKVAMDFFTLHLDDWVVQGSCKDAGKWFHAQLGDATTHAEDSVHDAYIGAALEMFRRGQLTKAQAMYNRWARFSGYVPINILSESPLRVDIHSHLLLGTPDSFVVERKEHA